MSNALFEDMKRYVGFTAADAAALVELADPLRPLLAGVVDLFYDVLMKHPQARAVFAADPDRVDRLRISLRAWLEELLSGTYDADYFERRCRIGRAHVRVNLPQRYMFTGMNVIRGALSHLIEQINPPRRAAKIESLNKLLDLELAIMNETYREDLISRHQALEQAQFRAQISKAEHLAAVGELAASLAHEIKNPLAGISGAIQIFGEELPDDHPHKEIIAESLRQIDRLDAAVKDLLIYARPKPPVPAPVSITQLLQRTLVLLREEPAFRGVRVEYQTPPEEVSIQVDENHIQQVFTNLLINAAHASQNGGAIRCRVESREGKVRIVIEDQGVGMSRESLDRAFEPFYTTKAKGTGLGLAICRRIVEAHQGSIALESQLGRGTRVTIELPERP